jgi:hypothetical protein
MLAVEDLVDLGEKLRAANFRLAPHQILSAQHVLAALEARNQLPKQRHQLAPWLGPIFCTSPAEQRRFPETFNEWLREHFGEKTPVAVKEVVPEVRPPIVPPRLRLVWKPALAGLVLLLAATTALAGWQHWRLRVVTGKVITAAEGTSSLAGAKVDIGEQRSITTAGDGSFSFETRAADLPVTLQISQEGFAPQTLDVGQDFATLRKRLYLGSSPQSIEIGAVDLAREASPPPSTVQIEMPAGAASAPDPIGPPRTIDLRSELKPPPFWERLEWSNVAWTLLPVIVFLLWQLWRVTRRPVLQRQASSAPPLLREMHLPPGVTTLAPGLPMRRLAQELRRRRVVNSAELQVEQTIAATLRNAGLFTPMLGSRVEPEYLALVDTACLSDHQARLCNEFIGELARSDVQIDRYTFDRTPAMCQRREAKGVVLRLERAAATVSIESLHARTPEHRVLLFCDGSGLFDSFTGAPAPCVATLLQWESPFLLTGKALEQWGETEWALENLGFKVLPLSREGVLWLMSTLSGAPAPQLARTSAKIDRPVPRYDRARRRWLERNPPDTTEVRRLCDSLASDLGERGFAWLAGCAVYPEIHWGITLRIGAALVPDREQREALLPKLARLIWLRDAYMPDWLRKALIDRLSKQDELRVRDVMYAMLVTLSGQAGADVPLYIATSNPVATRGWRSLMPRARAALEAWRKRHHAETLIRSAPADSPLRDYVFLRFISGQSAGSLTLAAPGALLKMLFRGGSPFLGFHTALVFATALVISGAIAVALGPLQTDEVQTYATRVWFNTDDSTFAAMLASRTAASEPRGDAGIVVARLDGTNRRTLRQDYVLSWSPDQRYMAVMDNEKLTELTLSLRNPATGAEVFSHATQPCTPVSRCPRFSRDGKRFAFPIPGGKIAVLDLSGTEVRKLPGELDAGGRMVNALAFSADSSLLAAGILPDSGGENSIVVWQLEPVPLVRGIIRVRTDLPYTLEFSADGRQLLGTMNDGVSVWDVESRQVARVMPLHQGVGPNAAIRPDGRVFAVAAQTSSPQDQQPRGVLSLLDASSGALLHEVSDPGLAALTDIDFSPDGRSLAASSLDGTVKLWSLPEGYPAPRNRRSFALVVANAYASRSIDAPYPLPMASQIADILRTRYGFGVTHLPNATGAQIRDALRQFGDLLQPEDQLLIYLVGRGRIDDGTYAFEGADARSDDRLRGGTLAALLQSIRAGQMLIVADTANARALASFAERDEAPGPLGSRELITSYTEGEPDAGGRRRFSPFGIAFGAALSSATGPRSSSWMLAETTRRMRAADPTSTQVPSYARIATVGDSGGEFEFPAPRGALTSAAAPVPDPNARFAVTGQGRAEKDRFVVDFGEIPLGTRSSTRRVEITNTMDHPVRIRRSWRSANASPESGFQNKDSCFSRTVGPNERCELMVEFTPTSIGRYEDRVTYMEGAAARALIILRGTAPPPYENQAPEVQEKAPEVQQQAPNVQQQPPEAKKKAPQAPTGLSVPRN